jgi:hypothetical protein
MHDKMKIVGRDGEVRYVVEDTIVTDIVHKHDFGRGKNAVERCKICKRTRAQIKESKNNARR